ncbi:hypothetical protein GCM10023208_01850 [Erythrobacter westpacificensis]|uniref:DUF4169 family protein n=1 Tax=Erythrobacter westpacificensis TaxID=1055231 RepID=A0ABP9JZM5_9SPHN
MSKDLSREERLAAQLRANLKRRKAQKKAMASDEASRPDADSDHASPGLSNRAGEG